MTSTTHPLPTVDDRPSRAGRAARPPVPAAEERWLGDPDPASERPARRPQGVGSMAAVGAVVLASVVGLNALAASAGSSAQQGGPGGFGGPGGTPNGGPPTGGFVGGGPGGPPVAQ